MNKKEQDHVDLCKALEAFVKKAAQATDNVYMAIDPGTTGAIGFVCAKLAAVVDIPTREVKKKRAVKTTAKERKLLVAAGKRAVKTKSVDRITNVCDHAATAEMLRILNPIKHKLLVLLEEGQVQNSSKFGGKGKAAAGANNVSTAFRVGINYGMWHLYFASRGWPLSEVHPASWKAKVGLTGKDKTFSLNLARKRHPKLATTALARVADHNRAEALLLADFHRQYCES